MILLFISWYEKMNEIIMGYDDTGKEIGPIDREEAHEKWLLHKSVHIRAVDTDKEKYWWNDVGIYLAKKSKNKSFLWNDYYQRTAGWHVDYDTSMLDDVNEQEKEYSLSLSTAVREIKEELMLDLLPKDLTVLESNRPNHNIKIKNKDNQTIKEDNNELLDIYSFVYSWDIKDFDKKEIKDIQIRPSKAVLKLLESNPELFGITQENTQKIEIIRDSIFKIQEKYGVK